MNLNDLDLSTIDSGDVEKLGSKIEEFYAQDNVVKATLSYHWERNHLMLDGNQWIVWDSSTTGGKWNKLETSLLMLTSLSPLQITFLMRIKRSKPTC
jgi:hypothetical protein